MNGRRATGDRAARANGVSATGFLPIQRSLGSSDALNEYIKHTSSAVFAVPGGVRPGGYVAQGLFERG